jgi:uncharacterized membrane protein
MRKSTDVIFRIGLAFKGIDSMLEVVGGVLLTMPTKLARYITLIAEHEVYRHHEALAGRLDHVADSVAMKASMVEAVYLIIHGLAKVILIYAVFRNRKWGYEGLVVVLTLFTLVELGRAITAREIFTGLFGLLDFVLAFLLYKELKFRFGPGHSEESSRS